MPVNEKIDRWIERFPAIAGLSARHLQVARGTVQFPILEAGAIAYDREGRCPNYVMCLDGRTRVYRTSDSGRELLLYKVGAGETCLLTTQCLLSGGLFQAESVAEAQTELAALPADTFHTLMADSPVFRTFVLDDYTRLLTGLFGLIDEIAHASLEQRLARRLLIEADAAGLIRKTHQQLASDLGSVREVVSRILGEWTDLGYVVLSRGQVEIADRPGLAAMRAA